MNRDLGKIIDITEPSSDDEHPGPLVPGASEPTDDVSPEFLLLIASACALGVVALAGAAWRFFSGS